MANNLGVSLDKLEETVQIIREQNQLMKTNLGNISSSVANLRSSWDSPASQNLSSISSKMSDRFVELEKDINAFANFLDGVIANYDVTEGKAETALQSILQSFS